MHRPWASFLSGILQYRCRTWQLGGHFRDICDQYKGERHVHGCAVSHLLQRSCVSIATSRLTFLFHFFFVKSQPNYRHNHGLLISQFGRALEVARIFLCFGTHLPGQCNVSVSISPRNQGKIVGRNVVLLCFTHGRSVDPRRGRSTASPSY